MIDLAISPLQLDALSRDPRIDPRKGDVVVSLLAGRPFTVDRVYSDGTISGHYGERGVRGSLCGLRYWRETWARDASVVKAAD